MSVLIVGTVAFDSIETPFGTADDVQGGSASFASLAASHFTTSRLVGVVGEDFPSEFVQRFTARGVDTAGLEVRKGGKTFFWRGKYHQDMNSRDTLDVRLNVIADYRPSVPPQFADSKHVFLANISPAVQLQVLGQIQRPELVVADTMDLWIQTAHADLVKLLTKLDGLLINDMEARLLTGEKDNIKAARAIRKMGPKFVIIKKGEHGAMLSTADGLFVIPAYPTDKVIDPTGAGDSFAGALMGALSSEGGHAHGKLRRAMAYGSVVASLTVEGFGLDALLTTTRAAIDARLAEYQAMLDF